jgi:hypothetical protein
MIQHEPLKAASVKQPRSSWKTLSPVCCVTHLLVGAVCFQVGLILGSSRSTTHSASLGGDHSKFANLACPDSGKWFSRGRGSDRLLPPSLSQLFAGAAVVNRTDFVQHVDIGVPYLTSQPGNEEVLVLYTSEGSFPSGSDGDAVARGSPLVSIDSAQKALENCLAVKVLLLQPRKPDQCVAIMGQWESYHLHLFRRIPKRKPRESMKAEDMVPSKEHALQYVSRGVNELGVEAKGLGIPSKYATNKYLPEMLDYMSKQASTLQRLEPVVKEAAGERGRTVVVMLVNFGQSTLFENFVCAARSRKLDLSNIVMFATDPSAVEISRSLGIKVFDVQDAFGTLPEEAARVYGDAAFKRMMLAKVYCVHLVVLLGYDVLFQDVDIVWHRNPLEYFRSPKLREFDMIAQDDGARSNRYSPWSFNTGLYFVRANPHTVFFFNMFARMGDVILKYRSHQGAMIALINEHTSWKGLRVKIIEKDSADGVLFPGGYHFHRRRDFMKRMIQGQENPYLFHISWTESKENKLLFLKQLGEWFVQPICENKAVKDLKPGDGAGDLDIASMCCLSEPVVECHYRDKPSKIPCRGSPSIDRVGRSFW